MTTRGSLFWINLGSTSPPEFGVASSPFMTRLDAAIALYLGD